MCQESICTLENRRRFQRVIRAREIEILARAGEGRVNNVMSLENADTLFFLFVF